MECMYHVHEAPTPVVTYSFPFQMAVLGEISLGWKKKPNLEQSSVKMTKENMTGGGAGADGETFSHQLFESLFLFKIIAPLHNIINIINKYNKYYSIGQCMLPETSHHVQLPQRPSFSPHSWTGRIQDQLWLMGVKLLSSKFLQNNVFRTLHSLLFRSCFY